jgi:enoyl-CoA hydratase
VSDDLVTLDVDRAGHVARLTIRRPEEGNLLTTDMARAIVEFVDQVDADDEVKVVVIEGEGEHLSRGWDPRDVWQQYLDAPGGSVRKHPSQRARLVALDDNWWGPRGVYARLLRCRKVTITLARGDCMETGLYLSLCSDLVVADRSARFGCPRWRNVGVDGDISLLVASVGLKWAKELMYCAAVWPAETAIDRGLVDVVTDDPDGQVSELAGMCASIMRDGIVTEKYAVFASLEKMGVGHAFATATVVGASMSNLHFQPGEYNFLKDVRDAGPEAALNHSRGSRADTSGLS